VSAGLVVLRLVDAWVEEGAAAVAADGWGMRSVEAAIEEVDDGLPARSVLRSVVTALKASQPNDMRGVAPRLLAYGRALDLDAKWALAADVYETVIAHVHPVEESDVAIAAHIRAGHCRRNLGDLDAAESRFALASDLARTTDDLVGTLRAQIGLAKVATSRGNLPFAEQLLDETVATARENELADIHSLALHDRADVAHLRGNYELAIRLAYEVLVKPIDSLNRDRLLNDIAGSFYMLGVRSAARDAYLILESTAQEIYARWTAGVNLMQIAAEEGSAPLFERYRRRLLAADLPPQLRVQFLTHVGDGYDALGDLERAAESLTAAHLMANSYGFNQLSFAVEEKLVALASAARKTQPEEARLPDEVRGIAAALRSMRELVET
jgi:tetratricopeptide (TPR) repeat protein